MKLRCARILCAFFLVTVSAQAQFTLELHPVSPGTANLEFTLEPGYFHRLEGSGNLSTDFAPMSGWMLGDGTLVTWPIHYPTGPASSGGGSGTTATGDTFSIYPFDNGKSLVTWDGSGGTLSRALIAQNFATLPPLLTLHGSQTTPYLTLLLGNLAWDPAYATLDPALLTAAQQTVLARLTSRYAEVLAAASGGSGGPGLVIDSPRHFFRLRRVEADADLDGLDWPLRFSYSGPIRTMPTPTTMASPTERKSLADSIRPMTTPTAMVQKTGTMPTRTMTGAAKTSR